jgi:hypothetical protein
MSALNGDRYSGSSRSDSRWNTKSIANTRGSKSTIQSCAIDRLIRIQTHWFGFDRTLKSADKICQLNGNSQFISPFAGSCLTEGIFICRHADTGNYIHTLQTMYAWITSEKRTRWLYDAVRCPKNGLKFALLLQAVSPESTSSQTCSHEVSPQMSPRVASSCIELFKISVQNRSPLFHTFLFIAHTGAISTVFCSRQ